MKQFNYDLKPIEKEYGVPEGFFSNDNAIIDNEIMNDISDDWNYEKAKISVTGILYRDKITIYLAENEEDLDFKNELSSVLVKLNGDVEMFALNKFMEIGNFKGDLCLDIEIKEIKPFNAKGFNKDRFFEELKKAKVIPDIEIYDVFKGDSGLCVTRWKEYIETKDFDLVMNIVSHNINCLLKESVIQKNKQFFLDNWEVDEKNFMLRKKGDE